MSTRNFDVDASQLGAEASEPVVFCMLDFVGEPQFLHSAVGIITWGGEDWCGVGTLGRVDAVPDKIGYSASRVRLQLSVAATEILGQVINENTWGRLCELWLGNWDSAALVRDPDLLIRGRMGAPEASIGGKASGISVIVEDIRGMLDRVNGLRSTILDHQREAPADTFYKYLPRMLDHRFIFNGGKFGGNNLTGAPSGPMPGMGYDDWYNP